MTVQVAFLRAVNVGNRRATSSQLVAAVQGLGYADVWTFINSGNVVVDAPDSRRKLEDTLEGAFEVALGFEATTFVRSAAELRRLTAAVPFELGSSDTYFLTFVKDTLTPAQASALEALSNDFDTLLADGRQVHWRMRGRSIESKLKAKHWSDIVGHNRSTSRNVTMLRKLVDKLRG